MYFKTREKIFIAAFTLGVPLAAVWFIYRSTETSNYFDIPLFHSIVVYICMFVSLLPSVVIYAFLYGMNRSLIKAGAKHELRVRQGEIIEILVGACVSKEVLLKTKRDLIDECAWASLQEFWSKE